MIEVQEHGALSLVVFDGPATEEEYRSYLARLTARLAASSHGSIVDARRSQATSPGNIRLQAEWLRANRGRLLELDFSTVLVMDQPVVRFALSAMLSIAPIPGHHTVTGSMQQGAFWMKKRLESKGRAIPAVIEQLCGETLASSA